MTSVDLSSAVEANRKNFPDLHQHRVGQADIRKLPFAPGQYDLVVCVGVIQHTPDPDETIASLAAQVKPGGWLVFDHYRHTLSYLSKISEPVFRQWLKRMPPQKGLEWTERLVRFFLPLHKLTRNYRLGQMALSRISPIRAYYQKYPFSDGAS